MLGTRETKITLLKPVIFSAMMAHMFLALCVLFNLAFVYVAVKFSHLVKILSIV